MDDRGLEGLPLQLLLTVVVLGLTLPVVFGIWTTSDRSSTLDRVRSSAETLALQIDRIYRSGYGNAQSMTVDFSSGSFTKVDRIEIGGPLNSTRSQTIRWTLSDGQRGELVIPSPAKARCNPCPGQVLVLSAGRTTIFLEANRTGAQLYVSLLVR